ncbi:ABC transporter periplasmic binding protein, polyamine [Neisseria gonorrhoeae]|uniref:ABC transporter periplasmic binding protein, polyamine n=1 Tax=Neisseria gonorrhoeae TaxID=485 RepID=A0A378VVC4_NEIGO|nr:ABC transporter periplasmic binding protein, polyamine [Neisseria gonorrhoeae]
MVKHLPLAVLTALLLAACGGSDKPPAEKPAPAENQNVLKIYNWSEYVDPETVADFEKKNGIKVTYDVYDSDETLESKVLTGKSGYDIVAPSNAFVGRQIKAGAYQKIDKSMIPNYKHLNPEMMRLMDGVDPDHEYAVPFYWGTNTFAINTERVKRLWVRTSCRTTSGIWCSTPNTRSNSNNAASAIWTARRKFIPWC